MEDDILKMEDDRKTTKLPNDHDCSVLDSQEDKREHPDTKVQEECAPPTIRLEQKTSPPVRRESTRGYSTRMVALEPASGRIRAENIDKQARLNCLVEDDGFGRKVSGHVTVKRG